jgi:hypothetical protein
MSEHPADRRRFKRIAFDARTELSQGEFTWPVKLVDLSFKGVLIERPDSWQGNPQQDFLVSIHLSEGVDITMDAKLAHDDHDQLGFACLHINLESIERLRRLIELNLADPQELERELGALIEI